MSLLPHQVDDFVNLTLPHFKTHQWTDLSLEHQEYVASELINKKNVKEKGGRTCDFRLKTRNTGNARIAGLFDQDVTRVEDVTISASVPWAMQTTNWSYDIYEDMFQSDRETIISELKIREHDALSDMAELQEELLWSAPSSSALTDMPPMGIPFWLQKDATTTPGGDFNGGNPSGWSTGAAGVDSTIYPRWRNWTFGFDKISKDDFVAKVKKSLAFTNFKAPVPHPELGYGKSQHSMYSTYRVTEALEALAESRNDNHGTEVARYIGQVTIGGVPVKWVPYLEANDLSDPLYGINWKVFRPFAKKGCSMRRSPVKVSPRQRNVREIHIDNWMNYICYNRRMCFVGSRG